MEVGPLQLRLGVGLIARPASPSSPTQVDVGLQQGEKVETWRRPPFMALVSWHQFCHPLCNTQQHVRADEQFEPSASLHAPTCMSK